MGLAAPPGIWDRRRAVAVFRRVSSTRRPTAKLPQNWAYSTLSRKDPTVSSPQHPISALQVRERVACMCEHGGACTAFAPGHGIHLIQARLAQATPQEWTDALVERVY